MIQPSFQRRRHVLAGLVLFITIVASIRLSPVSRAAPPAPTAPPASSPESEASPQPVKPVFAYPVPPESRRTRCARPTPQSIEVRLLSTPVLDRDVTIELTAHNRLCAGAHRLRVNAPAGALDFGAEAREWVQDFEAGETRSVQVRAKVTSSLPFVIVGQMTRVAAGGPGSFPGQGSLPVYPFVVREGRVGIDWDPHMFRPLGQAGSGAPVTTSATVTRPTGRVVPQFRMNVKATYRRAGDPP